jgi:hypothetical protein
MQASAHSGSKRVLRFAAAFSLNEEYTNNYEA